MNWQTAQAYEADVFEASRALTARLEIPEGPQSDQRFEKPVQWPLSDELLCQPRGRKREFYGLTYPCREKIKLGAWQFEDERYFGLNTLAWWHRHVWTGFKYDTCEKSCRTYADYAKWCLIYGQRRYLTPTLCDLYELPSRWLKVA